MKKEYNVWIRIERVRADNLQAAEKAIGRKLNKLKFNFIVLKKLAREFYPNEK